MEKTFAKKMRTIGQVAVFMSLVFFMFITGSIEKLPADITFPEIVYLMGVTLLNFGLGMFGISLINEE